MSIRPWKSLEGWIGTRSWRIARRRRMLGRERERKGRRMRRRLSSGSISPVRRPQG